jgi:hypothetical protein
MNDFTDKYNTSLTSEEINKFNLWAQQQNRNIKNEMYDYDIQGWWKQNQDKNLNNEHLTDIYKKPNHPTFSNQSQYHGIDDNEGGIWSELPDGSYTFTPGKTNLKLYKREQLEDYFSRVEQGNKLILPKYNLVPIDYNPFEGQ